MRLLRFVRDPRYRLLYGGPWKSPEELCDDLDGRLLTPALCASCGMSRSDRHVRNMTVVEKFWEEMSPGWEWPDYVGTFLFVLMSCWLVFWVSLKVEVLMPVALCLVLWIFRSLVWWLNHQEKLEQLHGRLQCQVDP